jgi:hypothetical protein
MKGVNSSLLRGGSEGKRRRAFMGWSVEGELAVVKLKRGFGGVCVVSGPVAGRVRLVGGCVG